MYKTRITKIDLSTGLSKKNYEVFKNSIKELRKDMKGNKGKINLTLINKWNKPTASFNINLKRTNIKSLWDLVNKEKYVKHIKVKTLWGN